MEGQSQNKQTCHGLGMWVVAITCTSVPHGEIVGPLDTSVSPLERAGWQINPPAYKIPSSVDAMCTVDSN